MNKERILNNSLNIIRKYLIENAPTMSLSSGQIAGTFEAKDENQKGPPVYLNKKPQQSIFRRRNSVQQKYSS